MGESKEERRVEPFEYLLRVVAPFLMRVGVWGAILGMLYVLRSIFPLIFLTFIFAYIQSQGVDRLGRYIANRTVRVVIVALVFLGVVVGIGAFAVPRVKEQANVFAENIPRYTAAADAELRALAEQYPALQELVGDNDGAESHHRSPTQMVLHSFSAAEGHEGGDLRPVLTTVRNIGTKLVGAVSAFLLSLLFSFLIVLDLPRLQQSARGLAHTRLGFLYRETAGTIQNFSRVLGKAFEAQIVIALLNTILTAIGLWLIGLGKEIIFFSVIVFFCSFIPVAGVFISSFPICLLALQEFGVSRMLLVIVLITVIHMVEAYILNPKIYGHHLRMNPVVVLVILTIAGKFFGVWGLVLGVPVCNYLFGHAIQVKGERREEVIPL